MTLPFERVWPGWSWTGTQVLLRPICEVRASARAQDVSLAMSAGYNLHAYSRHKPSFAGSGSRAPDVTISFPSDIALSELSDTQRVKRLISFCTSG